MAEVFVSYKAEDRADAKSIAKSLEAEGLTVWWDPELRSGEDYQEAIETNLRNALVVVVLWSPESVKSRWVRSEATIGDRKGALLPVMIRPCDRPVAFELVQTADLTGWQGDRNASQWRQFVGDVKAKVGERRTQTLRRGPDPISTSDLEALFWTSIKDSTDASDFESYITRYPSGHFVDLARRRLDARSKPNIRPLQWSKVIIIAVVGIVIIGAAIADFYPFFKSKLSGGKTATPEAPPSAQVSRAAPDRVIEIWFAGSPHRPEMPGTAVPPRILESARILGYTVRTRGHMAADFLPNLRNALAAGKLPDIIFIDNHMHIEGGKTALGAIQGIQSEPNLRSRLQAVPKALDELGRGWAFLISGSPDHDSAIEVVAELSGCATPMAPPAEEMMRRLQLQAEAAARDFLSCSQEPSLYDRTALARNCTKEPTPARRVAVCRITAAAKLAFVETAASFATERAVGRVDILSVHRLDDNWRLLVVSADPVTTTETVGKWLELATQFRASSVQPGVASLMTPDGVLPAPIAGERFGKFAWSPAEGSVIGQVVEMNYGNDTRLFLLGAKDRELSTGRLWTTKSRWHWRVWTVSPDGAIALSETRSFQR